MNSFLSSREWFSFLARLQICHLIPLFWPIGSSACRLYANFQTYREDLSIYTPALQQTKSHSELSYSIVWRFLFGRGKYGCISSYGSGVSSIIAHYTGFLFLVLTNPNFIFSNYKVRKTSYQFDIGLWKKVYKYLPTGKYPIAYITWNDATACTTWVEKRLSTEDE